MAFYWERVVEVGSSRRSTAERAWRSRLVLSTNCLISQFPLTDVCGRSVIIPPLLRADKTRSADTFAPPIRTMTDTMTVALAVRARLGVTLALFATTRGFEAAGSGDRRYAYAAEAIKRIAGTLDQVGDEV